MHADKNPPIKSTAFSFDIIEYIHACGSVTLPEVTKEFNKPKSTIHDHMATLTELGYLVKEGRSFRVSIKFLNLGGRARARSPFFQVAKGEVRQLAADTGEHANMMVEENGLGIFLYKERGPRSVNLDTYEGMEVYLHTTAMGKTILAEMSEDKREEIIDTYGLPEVTPNTITSYDTLMEEITTIRERGYAIDNEERIEGIRCIAAPITTADGVIGAVSISAPRSRMDGERFREEIPTEILSTANIIEVNYQHT